MYEYSCKACSASFEALVRGSEEPVCPSCDSNQLERAISIPSVQSESTHGLAMRAAKARDRKQAA
ncbi:MAG: zinc ribbon domain-containing protein, partial [Gemmatimonadetes bacterium]|nr:zinc ribbon domain-containing protein [Gemmatimonadota bacterium]